MQEFHRKKKIYIYIYIYLFCETSIKEFLALVDESIKESNTCQFLKGLNNKTKLTIYKTFGGEVKFKRYLNGVGDAGTRLLFKLCSGTHGLNEELGRHRGREGKYRCNLCGEDFVELPRLFRAPCIIFRASKK